MSETNWIGQLIETPNHWLGFISEHDPISSYYTITWLFDCVGHPPERHGTALTSTAQAHTLQRWASQKLERGT